MKRKFLNVAVSVVLCITIISGSILSASAEINVADIFAGLMGSSTGGKFNILEELGSLIEEKANEEGPIDGYVDQFKDLYENLKDGKYDPPENEEPEIEDLIVIDKAEASNIATLYNITVNELKKSSPGFVNTQTASMDAALSQQLQGGLGPVTGIVEALIGTKDIFAGIIDGTNNTSQVRTEYKPGNNIKNNLPVSGKDYVACLEAEDIKDFTIHVGSKGSYKIHIDLMDVEGSAAQSGLSHAFNTTDKAFATVELGTTSINISVMLKYVNNYVEVNVNRDGEITSLITNMGITFMFLQDDGTYGESMPYFNVNFEEEGIIYNINNEYSNFKYVNRKMGDINLDDKVNSSDARTVLRIASQLDPVSDEDAPYCDINCDGAIRAGDAREILRASAGIAKLPTTEDALGIKPYVRSEATQNHITDLLAILMAYQSVKDEEAQKELQDYYDDKYQNGGTVQEETTTKVINSTDQMIDEVLGGIGDFIGNGGFEGIFGQGGLSGILGKN